MNRLDFNNDREKIARHFKSRWTFYYTNKSYSNEISKFWILFHIKFHLINIPLYVWYCHLNKLIIHFLSYIIYIESNESQFLIYQIFYIECVRHHFWNTAVWRKKKWGKSNSIKMTSFSIRYFLTTRYQIRNIWKYTQAIFSHCHFQHCEILHIFNFNFLSWKTFCRIPRLNKFHLLLIWKYSMTLQSCG